jgi:hypothetical protein
MVSSESKIENGQRKTVISESKMQHCMVGKGESP